MGSISPLKCDESKWHVKLFSASIGRKQSVSKLNAWVYFEDYQKVISMYRKLSLRTCDARWRSQPRPPSQEHKPVSAQLLWLHTHTNVASTHTYVHKREHACYFSILLMVLIHQYTGVLTGAHIQTSICKCRDASVLGLSVRPLAIWINYVMSCTHSIWMDLDRKDLYRNLPIHDNIWASSKINKNTFFSRSHKCSNSGNLSINLS